MTHQPDYYRILQVHPRAEREVIDAAYRRLASKYHPDVNHAPDAAERMKQINIAYEVLSDPVKRTAYDTSLGMSHSADTPPHGASVPRYPAKAWRTLLIAAALMLLAVGAFRLGPAFLVLASRLAVPLVVIALVVWLFLTLVKPRG